MSNTMWIIIGVINAIIVIAVERIFNIPLWATLLVLIPLDIIALIIFSFTYNFRSSLKPQPIPSGSKGRTSDLDRDVESLRKMGFTKIDEFYLKIIPDSVVYLLKSTDDPIFIGLYHFGPRKVTDVVTLYNHDVSLTTGMAPDGANIPLDAKALLQIFPNFSPERLVHKHREGIEFLSEKGYQPRDFSNTAFRDEFMKSYRDSEKRVKKYPLWPLMLLVWTISGNGREYCKPIHQQFSEGMIKVKSV